MFFIFLFILGTILWSFWSVLLRRLRDGWSWPQLQSIMIGRSLCPHCQEKLSWWQLIPLLGWLLQKWKCRSCHQNISSLYLACELLSGLIFVWWWMRTLSYDSISILMLVMWWLLGLILLWDLYTYELHLSLWMIVWLFLFIFIALTDWSLLWGGLIGWAVFLALYLFGRVYVRLRFSHLPQDMHEGIGMGDVLIAPFIGVLLAYHLTVVHSSMAFSTVLSQASIVNIVQIIILYILATCMIGLCSYAIVRLLSWQKTHTPDRSQGMGPVIPFLPSMIISYRCMLFLFW